VGVRLARGPLPEIHVGAAAARLGADVHENVAVLGREEVGVNHVPDGESVVHGGASPSVHALVMAVVEVVQLRHERADAAGGAELVHSLGVEQGLVRDVEPDHGHVHPTRENAVCGFRIGPDVELGSGCDIALCDRPSHQHDASDQLLDSRVAGEEKADVRQRPDRHEDDAFVLLDLAGDEVDCMAVRGARPGLRQVRPVEAGLSVDVGSSPLFAHDRAGRAGMHRDVGAVDELEDLERVRGRLLEGLVARDRRDAEELDLRGGECEQKRDRVVVTGIRIEDDPGRHQLPSISSTSVAVGKEGWAPGRDAASAPAAQARSIAS
jgi:hypothetical protein